MVLRPHQLKYKKKLRKIDGEAMDKIAQAESKFKAQAASKMLTSNSVKFLGAGLFIGMIMPITVFAFYRRGTDERVEQLKRRDQDDELTEGTLILKEDLLREKTLWNHIYVYNNFNG